MQRYLLNIAYLGTRYKWVGFIQFDEHIVRSHCNRIICQFSGMVQQKNVAEHLSIESRLADAIKVLKPKNDVDIYVSSRWTEALEGATMAARSWTHY